MARNYSRSKYKQRVETDASVHQNGVQESGGAKFVTGIERSRDLNVSYLQCGTCYPTEIAVAGIPVLDYLPCMVEDMRGPLEAKSHASVGANDAACCPRCIRQAKHTNSACYLFAISWSTAHRLIIFGLVAFVLFSWSS